MPQIPVRVIIFMIAVATLLQILSHGVVAAPVGSSVEFPQSLAKVASPFSGPLHIPGPSTLSFLQLFGFQR
ncbi:hypothetical protein BDY19DRAFT_959711 [Irpex rosettiformis]|uniref:Uncharacterized protein n=1 Tax=Irpex rosettiformis TaxID=378272 RepID=A0ACB8TXX4_9APHY|nr:hypothetical protein BDY19DRAFT_959711 [Irpex rosettiformis]